MRSIWTRFLLFPVSALIFAAPTAETPSRARLRADLDFLCSDTLEGRVSLSRSADVSARYIAAEFARSGLTPAAGNSYLQAFPMIAYESDPKRTRLRILHGGKSENLRPTDDFRGGFWKETKITAPVMFAGYGITAPEYQYDDYAAVDAHGKVVLIFDHEPQETSPQSIFNGTGHTRYAIARVKVENAQHHGAVAVVMVSEPLRKHPGPFAAKPGQGQPLRASAPRQVLDEESIPVFQISDSAAALMIKPSGKDIKTLQLAIDEHLKPASMDLEGVKMEITTGAMDVRKRDSLNVVGTLEGSDPSLRSETVIIDAHYDHLGVQNGHLYGGANDNASGTVAVMELARLFARAPRPKRSLLFIVFGSEEEGLLGSYYYAEHPLRPLETTRAVLNLDMIARNEEHIPQSRGVLEISGNTANEINLVGTFYSPELRQAIVNANSGIGLEISEKFDRDHDLNVLFRCDHFPFLLKNVPAVWIFGGFHPGYHEPVDTVDRLNFDKLEKVTRLAYESAVSIADSATPPHFVAGR